MATENKTQETDNSVTDFISSLDDEQTISDCLKLVEMMRNISGHEPRMWGPAIIGFDKYHYKYESGREGDAPVIAFSPRKGKLTIYKDVDETTRNPELFVRLGEHTTSKVCIYIKRLSDIDMSVLSQIIEKSYNYTKSLDPTMHRSGMQRSVN
jgi:hypothetical protein